MAMAMPIAASSICNSFTEKDGRIGIRIPNPKRSIKTVKKISVKADLLFKC